MAIDLASLVAWQYDSKPREWICKFREPKEQIRDWLISNITDAEPFSTHSARDKHGKWVWRLALQNSDHRVLFNRESYAVLFKLTWGS